MQKSRGARFARWAAKVIVSYAAFFVIGTLLSLVPAGWLGLSETAFFSLRMAIMLLGPVYLTLIIRIGMAFAQMGRGGGKVPAKTGRGAMFAPAALLVLANLSDARTVSDLVDGAVCGRGLRNLRGGRRYPLRGERFLRVFLPVGVCLLLLEILTLLVCIVVAAPLPRAASNFFLLLIFLTLLFLLLTPLVLSLVSGFQGDRAAYGQRLARRKQAAERAQMQVLEADPARRRRYLRLPKLLFLLVCPGCLLLSIAVLALTRDAQPTPAIALLRQASMALAAGSFWAGFPLFLYWANCAGTSKVQKIYLAGAQLYYTGYSGSMEERVEFTFELVRLEAYRVGKRAVRVRGQFVKTTRDAYGTHRGDVLCKTLWIPRTFPPAQEQALLQTLQTRYRQDGNRMSTDTAPDGGDRFV